ncbi:hypothetical protein HBE96_01330 [Clostridium sp. P21]|uniref:Uncharacterized protein n=1 Tax=Clostridium muellerianum TaxID=2716538 RepID=A0A7Y0EDA0_9CLOT|nr:hypothetical protein [Clostridium muellerianum]NMM61361.1 hypothetical protein [Clostridium muellerianum]
MNSNINTKKKIEELTAYIEKLKEEIKRYEMLENSDMVHKNKRNIRNSKNSIKKNKVMVGKCTVGLSEAELRKILND